MRTLKMARPAPPLEKEEAFALMRAVRGLEHLEPRLKLLFHIPNGGWRAPRTAAEFQAQGVKPGVPDYFLPVPMTVPEVDHEGFVVRGYTCHGLWVELKRTSGKGASDSQVPWHAELTLQGYKVCVARGWYLALCYILNYLDRGDLIETIDGPR